jgi:hypothetical protein
MVPFLPGDVAKMVAAVLLAAALRRLIRPDAAAQPQKV